MEKKKKVVLSFKYLFSCLYIETFKFHSQMQCQPFEKKTNCCFLALNENYFTIL